MLSFADAVQTNQARSKSEAFVWGVGGEGGAQRGSQRALAFLDHILHKLPFEIILKVIN